LGDDDSIEAIESKIDKDRDWSEVPSSQRRAKEKTLTQYEVMHKARNKAILASFRIGGNTMKAIADHFRLHYSTVSKIIKFSLHSRFKTWSHDRRAIECVKNPDSRTSTV
jgi:putative transposase